MLKIGLLGRGSISRAHTNAYAKIENAMAESRMNRGLISLALRR